MLLHGDCIEKIKTLDDNSIDSIVTDPPYGLKFMGKKWDYDVPSVEIWKECLRVLKPGGHLLAFGGTRTYHRLVVNIEDAGFEIRDQIMWIYGSGFPKSMDISKAIDKEAGSEREVLGLVKRAPSTGSGSTIHQEGGHKSGISEITAPATEDAKRWSGWGTALKPANEPICLARKPLSEKTVAKNVLKHGTGGLNVDASRIDLNGDYKSKSNGRPSLTKLGDKYDPSKANQADDIGRFPANILFDEAAATVLDEQSGVTKSGDVKAYTRKNTGGYSGAMPSENTSFHKGDSGGASRFFYVAKASKKDRGEGNIHPTVKPIKLMEYLIRLVTPQGGTVLDPFMGSGTTGVSAKRLGFCFVGCERDDEYFKIASKRIGGV